MKTNHAVKNTWLALLAYILGSSTLVLACNVTSMFQPSTATPSNSPTFTASPTATASPTRTDTPTRTPTKTATPEPTLSIPSGTPLSLWHHIPIRSDAVAAEGRVEDRWYTYVTHADQDLVLDYYLQRLPSSGWEIDWVSENDKGGYIIYRKNICNWAQQGVQRTAGSLRVLQAFFLASSFFCSQAFLTPAPCPPLTRAVGRHKSVS
jgi:hypothetical protein